MCKIAARDLHETIVNSAFELTERLLRDHFALITAEAMPELVDALVSIAQSPFTDMALQALSHLARCAQVISPRSLALTRAVTLTTSTQIHLVLCLGH